MLVTLCHSHIHTVRPDFCEMTVLVTLCHTHIHTVRPDFCEMTVLGAAIAAGTAVGVWEDTSLLPEPATKQFHPALTSDGEDIAAV